MSITAEMRSPVGTVRLPVSGMMVTLRFLNGRDDLALLESSGGGAVADLKAALILAAQLATGADGKAIDWGLVSMTDLDALILNIRQMVVGDAVRADVACAAPGCWKRVDISFGIGQYLAHHAPDPAAGEAIMAAQKPGWYRFSSDSEDDMSFRVPTVGDQLVVAGSENAAEALAARCVLPPDHSDEQRQRIEATMEALAPSLSSALSGVCPECGATVEAWFEARQFCLAELRNRAAFIYQDVDVLARRYHWPEGDILELPQARRAIYVELARSEGVAS